MKFPPVAANRKYDGGNSRSNLLSQFCERDWKCINSYINVMFVVLTIPAAMGWTTEERH
jgi:hypothetical protein